VTGSAKPEGQYRFTDHSVLRPWVTRVWFARLFPLLPHWMAANLVTLISTGTLGSVIVGAVLAERIGPMWFALIQFFALQLYVAGDHLDGMQAKAKGTLSPLGDFLDHHCDLWAACVLIFGYWVMTGTTPLWALYAMTVTLIVAFAVTYVERAERRTLHFTKWGTLEAIAILSAFYLSWAVAPARSWWLGDLVAGVPRHLFIGALGTAMALGAIGVVSARLRRLPLPLVLNTATLIALAWWCVSRNAPPLWGWLLVSLAGADYVARVMRAHTTTQPRPWPDFVAPLVVLMLWVQIPSDGGPQLLLWLTTLWLIARYGVTVTRILWEWRQHLTWVHVGAAASPRTDDSNR
jgi:phosphatidylglycerophosphate synthase